MSATLLPELATESIEAADRLVRLSAEEGLDSAEVEYILTSGLAALQRVPRLWPIIRGRIGRGTTASAAHQLVAHLLEAVDRNLVLASVLKKCAQAGGEPEAVPGLDAAKEQLLEIRVTAACLLASIDAPARWPDEKQLTDAKESMARGERLTAEQFRQAQLGE